MSVDTQDRFAFGKNWQKFLVQISDERIEKAKKSLLGFLELPDLRGKSMIDIGCGSGLFSYAAHGLGASKLLSFDYDPNSVAATEAMWEKAGKPANWKVERGSVLDTTYLDTMQQFDIVYSWGVLHHTGHMWEAIRNAARLVAPRGFFYIALYNKVEGRFGSRMWWRIKKTYNRSPRWAQVIMEWIYVFIFYILANLLRGKNPLRAMHSYGAARGMRWKEDVADWLG
ncbi:class I SAM-dependent methyltransferase, partial [Candidatus Kaiserbacteria bacterium]|nr:class I SAM-dependent methyltransferase [Candidatus Kaiserbacteria bacterium]